MPGGGIEPPRAEARRILSPLRLPVPPSRQRRGSNRLAQAKIGPKLAVGGLRSKSGGGCRIIGRLGVTILRVSAEALGQEQKSDFLGG